MDTNKLVLCFAILWTCVAGLFKIASINRTLELSISQRNVRLGCRVEGAGQTLDHAHNALVWLKKQDISTDPAEQEYEVTAINSAGIILQPFSTRNMFRIERAMSKVGNIFMEDIDLIMNVTEASNALYVCELRGAQAVLGSVTYLVHVIGNISSVSLDDAQPTPVSTTVSHLDPMPYHPRADPNTLTYIEGYPGVLSCQEVGGNPLPRLQLTIAGEVVDEGDGFRTLTSRHVQRERGLNVYKSRQTVANTHYSPSYLLNGKQVTCRATPKHGKPRERQKTMRIYFAPKFNCTSRQAISSNKKSVTCLVLGNPLPSRLEWTVKDPYGRYGHHLSIPQSQSRGRFTVSGEKISPDTVVSSLRIDIQDEWHVENLLQKVRIFAQNELGANTATVELIKDATSVAALRTCSPLLLLMAGLTLYRGGYST